MKNVKIIIVLIGYCMTSMLYASQAQQKTKEAAAATSSSSSSSSKNAAEELWSSIQRDLDSSSVKEANENLIPIRKIFEPYLHGSSEFYIPTQSNLNWTLYYKCTDDKHYQEVATLLQKGANPNTYQIIPWSKSSSNMMTALSVAVYNNQQLNARVLMRHGANPYFYESVNKELASKIVDVRYIASPEMDSAFKALLERYVRAYTLKFGIQPVNTDGPGKIPTLSEAISNKGN